MSCRRLILAVFIVLLALPAMAANTRLDLNTKAIKSGGVYWATTELEVVNAQSNSAITQVVNTAPWNMTANRTLTKPLRCEAGGIITTTGYTLTLAGFDAGEYQTFAGTGTVAGLTKAIPEWFGAVGDGTTDDTTALVKTMGTTAPDVYLSKTYRVVDSLLDGTAVLTSTVDNRTIHGPGTLTATSQVKKLLLVTGDNNVISLHVDGNSYIGYAIQVNAENPTVTGCHIHDLNGFTNWGGVAIRLYLAGIDTSAVVSNNLIHDIQGTGDETGGNGVGMQRGVWVETDQDCVRKVLISGNNIYSVMGEEGDSIVVAGGTTADTKIIAAVISGNVINGWSRRAIKIAANGVSVTGNHLTNNLSETLTSLQRVIDATSASDLVISSNVLEKCNFQSQIGVWLTSPQVGNNIVIAGNTIDGVGSTVDNDLIVLRTYGTGVAVNGNTFNTPDHAQQVMTINQATDVFVAGNTISSGNITWYDFTDSTNVRLGTNVLDVDANYHSGFNVTDNEWVFDISAGKSLTLSNRDSTLSADEIIGQIKCRINDDSTPDTVMASVGFVADGTVGQTAVAIYTGYSGAENVERLRVTNVGTVRPGADNTQNLGNADYRWKEIFAGTGTINTSDAREKTDFQELSDRERKVAIKLKGLVKRFKFISETILEGEEAKYHIGLIAQDVVEAFASEGLDAMRYACVDYREWTENGETKSRYGIRYNELLAFIIGAM